MTETKMRVLAFGAAGPIAGLVPPELAHRGAHVRAFIREAGQRDEVLASGCAEAAIGDLADADSVDAAMVGMDAVFYIPPVDLPDQAAVGRRIVAQAVEAGIRRFVFSSVIHPVLDLPNHQAKAPVEDALINSGLEYAILHPTMLYQNFDGLWSTVLERHVFAEPWANETRHTRVDYRDVAEVAAIALFEDRLTNGTFELCAPGMLDRHDVAALISDVLEYPISAERIDPATLGHEVDAIRPMFAHYDRHGLSGNPLVLRSILGREPRTLRAYFEELSSRSN